MSSCKVQRTESAPYNNIKVIEDTRHRVTPAIVSHAPMMTPHISL